MPTSITVDEALDASSLFQPAISLWRCVRYYSTWLAQIQQRSRSPSISRIDWEYISCSSSLCSQIVLSQDLCRDFPGVRWLMSIGRYWNISCWYFRRPSSTAGLNGKSFLAIQTWYTKKAYNVTYKARSRFFVRFRRTSGVIKFWGPHENGDPPSP